MWDLGGGTKFRTVWSEYYSDIDVLIWIVDCNLLLSYITGSDQEKWDESITEYNKLRSKSALKFVPICILANKQDLPNAKSKDQVIKAFETLDTTKQPITVIETSMVEEKGVPEAIQWVDMVMKSATERTNYRKSIAQEEVLPESES